MSEIRAVLTGNATTAGSPSVFDALIGARLHLFQRAPAIRESHCPSLATPGSVLDFAARVVGSLGGRSSDGLHGRLDWRYRSGIGPVSVSRCLMRLASQMGRAIPPVRQKICPERVHSLGRSSYSKLSLSNVWQSANLQFANLRKFFAIFKRKGATVPRLRDERRSLRENLASRAPPICQKLLPF
jgi:hypothetical protein